MCSTKYPRLDIASRSTSAFLFSDHPVSESRPSFAILLPTALLNRQAPKLSYNNTDKANHIMTRLVQVSILLAWTLIASAQTRLDTLNTLRPQASSSERVMIESEMAALIARAEAVRQLEQRGDLTGAALCPHESRPAKLAHRRLRRGPAALSAQPRNSPPTRRQSAHG